MILRENKIAGGQFCSVALKNDGTVWTFGNNDNGQLGNGTNTSSNIPVQVSLLTDITDMAAGGNHSIAVKSDGTIWTWGWYGCGQLGEVTFIDSNIPVQETALCQMSSEGNDSGELSLVSVYSVLCNYQMIIYGTKAKGMAVMYIAVGIEMLRQETLDDETKINCIPFSPGFYLLSYHEENNILYYRTFQQVRKLCIN